MDISPTTNSYWKNVPYPIKTAECAVDPFLEKYARAANYFAKKLGMDPKYLRKCLINCFRYQNARWQRVRDAIKSLEIQNRYEEYKKVDYETFVYYMSVNDFLEHGSFSS